MDVIAELRALLDKASFRVPLEVDEAHAILGGKVRDSEGLLLAECWPNSGDVQEVTTARALVAAVNALPALLAVCEAAQEIVSASAWVEPETDGCSDVSLDDDTILRLRAAVAALSGEKA